MSIVGERARDVASVLSGKVERPSDLLKRAVASIVHQLYPGYMHGSCPEGGRFPDKERVFGIDLGSGARPAGPGMQGSLPSEMGLLTEVKMLYFHGAALRCVSWDWCSCQSLLTGRRI